jgi:hypothetical protein
MSKGIITRFALLAAAVGLLAGCPCGGPYEALDEDFEYCTGSCDWVLEGEGAVAVVETIHPAEHGLRLDGPVRASKTADAYLDWYGWDMPYVELVSNCTGQLWLDLTFVGGQAYDLTIALPPGKEFLWNGDYQLLRQALPRQTVEASAPLEIRSVTLWNQSGVCVVDQLRIMQPGSGYCEG